MRHMGLMLCGLLVACVPTSSARVLLLGSGSPGMGTAATPTRSETVFTRGVDETSVSTQLEAPAAEGVRVFNGHDVVQQLVLLRKPGEVAAWWDSEPKAQHIPTNGSTRSRVGKARISRPCARLQFPSPCACAHPLIPRT